MTLIRIPPSWEISENQITPEAAFFNRRRFLQTLIGGGIGMAGLSISGCQQQKGDLSPTAGTLSLGQLPRNSQFEKVDRPLTQRDLAARYNNFYEYGGDKGIWRTAQALPTEDWKVEVTGLVNKPQTYDLEDLQRKFPIEERIYRFRCVEAWAMVIPWAGFPMRLLLADVDPKSEAKFVQFSSYYNPDITKGPGWRSGSLPWPYREGLRIEEMANDLAFFATGIYGNTLPKQHGAPIRMVVPWKYGFKGAKSIVKIEFVEKQPATYWNTLVPDEYDFEANVNPDKPHPRWSQATERLIGPGNSLTWERVPTLPYNGYGEYVASLYA
jgi:methionine sulfoxide reductase catalytic subunit